MSTDNETFTPTEPEMRLLVKALNLYIADCDVAIRTPADEKLYPSLTEERDSARCLRDVIEHHIRFPTQDRKINNNHVATKTLTLNEVIQDLQYHNNEHSNDTLEVMAPSEENPGLLKMFVVESVGQIPGRCTSMILKQADSIPSYQVSKS